jgi:putative transposase
MKKHSPEEVRAKLGRARELADRGLSQAEICGTLGVSVMTFHRWRKLSAQKLDLRPVEETPSLTPPVSYENDLKRLRDLQLENQQLRKLVADLMLEKLHLQEAANSAAEKVGEPASRL